MAKLLMLFGLLFIACGNVEGSWNSGSSPSESDSSSSGAVSSSSGCLEDFVNWQVPPEHSYVHGSTDITLSPYLISANLITQGQYKAIMGESPSIGENNDMLPVEGVTWHKAAEFCRKLSAQMCLGSETIKLPTEAQWEYAINAIQIIDGYWEWTNDCFGPFPASQHDPSPVDCSDNFERVVKGTHNLEYRIGIHPDSYNMGNSIGAGYISFRIVKK
ncbi:MAG: SUMF1/EgtB/PvdO family nonheme iron enzyme [Fibromonadales bacterium]|nr:SUMF1/EgtB/PvdO family nonheme iron enzyme [Fibromonadales bacterium]